MIPLKRFWNETIVTVSHERRFVVTLEPTRAVPVPDGFLDR